MRFSKLAFFGFILALSFVLCACSGNVISKIEANESLEKVFGDVKELPMDIADVKEKLSDDVIVSSDKQENSKDSTEIVVGDGVVLYHTVSETSATSPSGHRYSFTIEVMHFGGAEIKEDNQCTMRFVGANVTMTIESDKKDEIKAELLAMLENEDFSAEVVTVWKDLFDEKKVYVEAGSDAWDIYTQVEEEIQTTYDEELGTFWATEEPEYDEMYGQYSYDVKDFSGRVKERYYYKVDESGKKWTTEYYEYTYLANGDVKKYSVSYYDFTEQIWSEDVYIGAPDAGGLAFWSKSYRDDGSKEHEQYYNDDGNYVIIEYFNDNSINSKRICLPPSVDDGEGLKEIYSEEYASPGILFEKWFVDGNLFTRENYFPNGALMEKMVTDSTRFVNGEELFKVEYVNGYEDGSKDVFTFHDNGENKSVTFYNTRGVVVGENLYYENGNTQRSTMYYEDGTLCIVDEHYESGVLKTRTEYNEQGEIFNVTHFDENGDEIEDPEV